MGVLNNRKLIYALMSGAGTLPKIITDGIASIKYTNLSTFEEHEIPASDCIIAPCKVKSGLVSLGQIIFKNIPQPTNPDGENWHFVITLSDDVMTSFNQNLVVLICESDGDVGTISRQQAAAVVAGHELAFSTYWDGRCRYLKFCGLYLR